MKNLPTLYLTISTGWAIRNFIYTGIVARLSQRLTVVLLCDPHFHAAAREAVEGTSVETLMFDAKTEPFGWRIMRQFRKKIYLESRNSQTEQIWESYGKRPFLKRVSGQAIKALLWLVGPQKLQRFAVMLDLFLNRTSEADNLLRSAPANSYFFATHASSFFEESLFRAAQKYCRQTVLMILSWDHLSSKIVLGPGFDYLFVWNEVSKQEIVNTLDFYSADQVHIVGAPQFDVYAEPSSLTYNEWCQVYGLDPTKKTVLFSTIPQVRNDGQHRVLEMMAQRFLQQPETFADVQILVKVHPLDTLAVYDPVLVYPFVKFVEKHNSKASVAEEYALSANRDALSHATLNINTFSTMTLEAAALDCPIIHLAFDLEGQSNTVPTVKYYEFEHFRPITESCCAAMAYSFDELIDNIATILEGNDQRGNARRAVARQYFSDTIGTAADRVYETTLGIICPDHRTVRIS
jgi:hypothetical protein